MKIPSKLDLIMWGLVALAAAGLLAVVAKWKHDAGLLKSERKEHAAAISQLNAVLEGERANRKTEQDDRRLADEKAKSLEAELAAIRGAPQPVSVYCRPARVPGAAGEGGSAAIDDGGAGGPGAEGPVRDIGGALADVWREHQSNAARARALIDWERARTH